MKKVISLMLALVMCLPLCACGDVSDVVPGVWRSDDWGEGEYIEIIISADGNCSRYFYARRSGSIDAIAGRGGFAWDSSGKKVSSELFEVEYDAKTDTLIEKEGKRVRVYERFG